MGNCLVQESSMHWGGDDWGSPAPDDEADHQPFFSTKRRRSNHSVVAVQDYEDAKMDEKGSFGNSTTTTSSSSSRETTTTEVKIKVPRRQLERLLGKVDLKELSVQEVLAQLMIIGAGAGEYGVHEESWRPALHSIPE